MAILGYELEEIERLLQLISSSDLEELVWEEEDRCLIIKGFVPKLIVQTSVPQIERELSPTQSAQLQPQPTKRAEKRKPISTKDPNHLPDDHFALVSPMVGVFYRAGKTGDAPFIEVGQRIVPEQTIGIIEAMKIFSEIPAEQGGIVVSIPAQDGQLVEAGMAIVILKKN